ncbi:hypothetical protein A2714_04525 [Candidatus Woesebacteria bacterium RIFCSPHIGHO2_01_FULL_38_9]|uniref:Uncharacterized protein n=2 Tax=Candidatus Woeseibacteriota TaxID=1752722 RepID=A0A1F7XZT9_9BACT|nr:MAG: hypothetical protein A2714_04525 [Candidatus Woesebacteria bacterium RIFCSPHIGHO2_01_FULL_38_9]OGM58348.1 MAG: hypothetical protein A3A75_04945 [Candidatus Woesebacteria bacterium RIFCSPLOWO2_01_FULL_39_10]
MKNIVKILYFIFCTFFIVYLFIAPPTFPSPPSDALQSNEPGDTETPLRRAYFTNLTREEVLAHYQVQLERSPFLNIYLPTYRLNYPPEEAQMKIRDQTRSTFLEELVHPLRESLFVNGFEPKQEKDTIFIEGRKWRQKITVRFIPSRPWVRISVGLAIAFLIPLVMRNLSLSLVSLREKVEKE